MVGDAERKGMTKKDNKIRKGDKVRIINHPSTWNGRIGRVTKIYRRWDLPYCVKVGKKESVFFRKEIEKV